MGLRWICAAGAFVSGKDNPDIKGGIIKLVEYNIVLEHCRVLLDEEYFLVIWLH